MLMLALSLNSRNPNLRTLKSTCKLSRNIFLKQDTRSFFSAYALDILKEWKTSNTCRTMNGRRAYLKMENRNFGFAFWFTFRTSLRVLFVFCRHQLPNPAREQRLGQTAKHTSNITFTNWNTRVCFNSVQLPQNENTLFSDEEIDDLPLPKENRPAHTLFG